MKKLLTLVFSLVVALIMLVGCAGKQRLDGSWGALEITSQTPAPRVEAVEFNILGHELTGSNGCALINARVHINGDRLQVTEIKMGTVGCPMDAAGTQQVVMDLLESQPKITIEDDVMTLQNDETTLVLEKR